MKLSEFYTINECKNTKKVFTELNKLVKEDKISWMEIDTDIIKVHDLELSDSELKKLTTFFNENDVNEYYDALETDTFDETDEEEQWDSGDIYDF